MPVLLKTVLRQKRQLELLLCGESVDYIFALAPLEAFYGVDAYITQCRNAEALYLFSYGCYLVAVGDNHPHAFVGVERRSLYGVDILHQPRYHSRFGGVDLAGNTLFVGDDIDERHSMGVENLTRKPARVPSGAPLQVFELMG